MFICDKGIDKTAKQSAFDGLDFIAADCNAENFRNAPQIVNTDGDFTGVEFQIANVSVSVVKVTANRSDGIGIADFIH